MEAVLPLTDGSDADSDTLFYPARALAEDVEEEEEEEDEDVSVVPYNPFGVTFLRRIKVDVGVPRMRAGGRYLTPPAFKHLFRATEEEIRYKYFSVGLIPNELTLQARVVTNKKKFTPTYVNFSAEPEPVLFNLAQKGHTLPPPPEDGGSDIETDTEPDQNDSDIDISVSQMWRQFLIDIAVKTPVARGSTSPSYLKLSEGERTSVGEDLYKNGTLSDMWRACQYKLASPEDWNRAFDHLFPSKNHVMSATVQNYRQCKYYIKWKEICATADESSVAGIRRQLKKKVNTLLWIPHACQDKLWPTSQLSKFICLPPNLKGPAPRILIKSS
jgi:hypothetical protein